MDPKLPSKCRDVSWPSRNTFSKSERPGPPPLNERRQDTNPNKKRVKRGLPEEGLTFINIPGVSVGKCKIKKQKSIFFQNLKISITFVCDLNFPSQRVLSESKNIYPMFLGPVS